MIRHPELPPLTSEVSAPRLKDYLDKPRLVSTYGRRPSQVQNNLIECDIHHTWEISTTRRGTVQRKKKTKCNDRSISAPQCLMKIETKNKILQYFLLQKFFSSI